MSEVLVLGSGFGGANVALRAAAKGMDVEVLDRNGYHTYTPGLIDLYRERYSEEANIRNLNDLYAGSGVEFSQEVVEDIVPGRKRVVTNAGEKEYEKLVVALGSVPRRFGNDLDAAEDPYTLEGVRSTKDRLEDAESVGIVGSGYVGVEIAGELAEMGKEVTVIDGDTRPMPASSQGTSHRVLDYFNRSGVKFRGGRRVDNLLEDGVEMEDGETLEFDMTFWAPGVKAPEVVERSLGSDPAGLEVDGGLESTEHEDVYAVGDVADTDSLKTAHNAMKQSEVVARNLAGGDASFSASRYPLIVSMGDTGLVTYGDRCLESRAARFMKDRVRNYYWMQLEKNRLKARAGLSLR